MNKLNGHEANVPKLFFLVSPFLVLPRQGYTIITFFFSFFPLGSLCERVGRYSAAAVPPISPPPRRDAGSPAVVMAGFVDEKEPRFLPV